MRQTKIRKTKSKIRKSKTRNRRNVRGGAAAGPARQNVSCPLLDDLLEDILEEIEEVNRIPRRDLLVSGIYVHEIRLTAIAKISELDDNSREAVNKDQVIRFLLDQQARFALERGNPNLLIQPEDIQEKILQMRESEDDEYEFLEVYGTNELKALINQFMQMNQIG